jgi:hypothetical protein
MQVFFKWLRGFGPIGSAAANGIQLVTTNWVLTMSALIGIWAALTDWVVAFVQNPKVQTAVIVFLAILWTGIGIAYLIDRQSPRLIRVAPDYRYGLTFEGVTTNLSQHHEEQWLQLGVQIRNYSQAPIRYIIDRFDLRIGTRALAPSPQDRPLRGNLPRGGVKIGNLPAFKKDDLREFFGKQSVGRAECSIIYGHPEQKPIRRLTITLNVHFEFGSTGDPPFGFAADIMDEVDEPYVEPPPVARYW